jgi:hypothetical protein
MLKVIGVAVFVCLMMALSFESGQYYMFYKTKPTAITNACAHYDMKTGNFTWGAPPKVIEQVAASELKQMGAK